MRACLALIVLLAALAFVADAADSVNSPLTINTRGTIHVPMPSCVFWQCTSACRSRGYWRGGYCTLNGCQCLI
nr:gallerimycin 2 [Dioryctria sylvestrella]